MRVLICVAVETDNLSSSRHFPTVPVTGARIKRQVYNEISFIIDKLEGVDLATVR